MILVIDDEQDILDLVSFHLEKAGFKVLCATSGDEGLRLIQEKRPDLVVLDIMLPGLSGVEVLKQIKYDTDKQNIPVLMLTAKTEEVDRILGFELGADDYLTKPFSVRELLLRIKAILSRLTPIRQSEIPLRCGRIEVATSRREVKLDDESLDLTSTEFDLLTFLLRNVGRVVTREQLLQRVWGYSYGGNTRTVDTHIQRLREKLKTEAHQIQTVRGIGYKLKVPSK